MYAGANTGHPSCYFGICLGSEFRRDSPVTSGICLGFGVQEGQLLLLRGLFQDLVGGGLIDELEAYRHEPEG